MNTHPLIVNILARKQLLTQLKNHMQTTAEWAVKADLDDSCFKVYAQKLENRIDTLQTRYKELVEEHHGQPEFSAEEASPGSSIWYLSKTTFSVLREKPVYSIIAQGSEDNMKELCAAMVQFYSTPKEEV